MSAGPGPTSRERWEAEIKALRAELAEANARCAQAESKCLKTEKLLAEAQRTLRNLQEAEEQLLISEEKFAKAFAGNPAAIALTRLDDGEFIEVNDTWVELNGRSREEAIGRSARLMKIWPNAEAALRFREELAANGFIRGWEQEFLKKSGESYIAQLAAQVLTIHGVPMVLATLVDITDRKRAEQQVSESAERLRLLGDNLPNSLIYQLVREPDGALRFSYLSAGVERLNAVNAIDAMKDPNLLFNQVHPDDKRGLLQAIEASARDLSVFEREARICLPDGQVRWMRLLSRPRRLPNGGTVWDGVQTDITRLKGVEEDLRLTKERFEVALRDSSVVVFNQDLDLRYTWIYNPALGHKAKEVIGTRDTDLFERVEDGVATETIKAEVIRTGVAQQREVRIHAEGIDRYYDLLVVPLRDDTEAIVGVTCAAIDITQRKHAEREIETARRRLELAIEVADVGEWEVNLVDGSAYRSPRQAHIFGLEDPCTEWSFKLFLEHVVPEHRAEVEQHMHSCLATGSSDFRCQIRRADGILRWVWIRGRSSRDSSGRPEKMYGTVMDITERKLAEEGLIRSEKLLSVGKLAMTVAHEINNPLEVITNSIYLASLDQNVSPDTKEFLSIAQQELKRVAHLTRRTLGFYREDVAKEDTSLNGLLADLVELYKSKLSQRNIRLEQRSRGGDVVVPCVPSEIKQVVSSLLTNAVDAMPSKGRLLLRTCFTSVHGDAKVRLTIADTGEGISANHLRRVFEPFFTTKDSYGTGLGLWISHDIVRRHNGTIRIRSIRGQGTVVSILLPVSRMHEERTDGVGA